MFLVSEKALWSLFRWDFSKENMIFDSALCKVVNCEMKAGNNKKDVEITQPYTRSTSSPFSPKEVQMFNPHLSAQKQDIQYKVVPWLSAERPNDI